MAARRTKRPAFPTIAEEAIARFRRKEAAMTLGNALFGGDACEERFPYDGPSGVAGERPDNYRTRRS